MVDLEFSASSPSWKAFHAALPWLRQAGWEFTVWTWRAETDPSIEVVRLFSLPVPRRLRAWVFCAIAHFHWLVRRMTGGLKPYSASISNGFLCTFCDFQYVHFSHFDYAGKQLKIPVASWQDFFEIGLEWTLSMLSELLLFWSPSRSTLIAVSEAVLNDLRRFAAPWKRKVLLPNVYDPDLLEFGREPEHRKTIREKLSIGEPETVYAFVSQGHYRRKGFWLAVEAIRRLRGKIPVRFLVIGGHPATLKRLQARLNRIYPEWKETIVFTGMVEDATALLAASDALLFPSYSEAFSLAAIEAATLGLRLYLTPHHGSEMLLGAGCPGRYIPWDPGGIVSTLEEDLRADKVHRGAGNPGRALMPVGFANAFAEILDVCVGNGNQANTGIRSIAVNCSRLES